MIVYRWTPESVVILDPNSGLCRLQRATFEEQWSGYLVEYRPTPHLRPVPPSIRPASFLLHWIRLHQGFMALALCFALLATSLGWADSFFLRTLIDEILPNRATSLLLRGYETQVARGGDNFSSGQAQRIALARALLKDAPILILDEATSNLDGATKQGILQALEENRRVRTTIVIAHRLSTVINAD